MGKSFLNPSRYAVIPDYLSEKIVFQLLTDFWLENLPNGVISVVNSDTSYGNTGKISEIFDFAATAKCAIFTNGGSKIARKFGENRQNLHETVTHSLIGFVDQKIIKFGEKYSCFFSWHAKLISSLLIPRLSEWNSFDHKYAFIICFHCKLRHS